MPPLAPRSALDVIAPAFAHAKQQIWPFEWSQWWRLALLGLAAGELGNAGCNFSMPSPGRSSAPPSVPPWLESPPWAGTSPAVIILGALMLLVAFMAFWLLMTYVSSVCRFVLIETIVNRRSGGIRAGWRKWRGVGRRYLLWQLAFMGAIFGAVVVVASLGIVLGVSLGAFSGGGPPAGAIALFVLGGMLLFLLGATFFVMVIAVYVVGKDFMAPILAIEQAGIRAAWRKTMDIFAADKLALVGYLFVKLVMSIAVAIVVGIVLIVLLLPTIVAGILGAASGAIVWTPATIAAIAVVGALFLVWMSACLAFINVPFIAFFPAYGLYFLASRYEPLNSWLNPPDHEQSSLSSTRAIEQPGQM